MVISSWSLNRQIHQLILWYVNYQFSIEKGSQHTKLTFYQNWSRLKKYWCLALISTYACVNSYGENNWGAAWTTISKATGLTIGQMNGGSALNYLLLGFGNVLWIPTAMLYGRKICYIGSLIFVTASSIWGGVFKSGVEYYLMEVVSGIGTSAYQALIQLTVSCLIVVLIFVM